MGQITIYSLMDAKGNIDYDRYKEAVNNWDRMQRMIRKNNDAADDRGNLVDVSTDNITFEYINPAKYRKTTTTVTSCIAKITNELVNSISYDLDSSVKSFGANACTLAKIYACLYSDIEQRYSLEDYIPEIVVNMDGRTAHLMSQEEEVDILEEAFERIVDYLAHSHGSKAVYEAKMKKEEFEEISEEVYEKSKQAYMTAKEKVNILIKNNEIMGINKDAIDYGIEDEWMERLEMLY